MYSSTDPFIGSLFDSVIDSFNDASIQDSFIGSLNDLSTALSILLCEAYVNHWLPGAHWRPQETT